MSGVGPEETCWLTESFQPIPLVIPSEARDLGHWAKEPIGHHVFSLSRCLPVFVAPFTTVANVVSVPTSILSGQPESGDG